MADGDDMKKGEGEREGRGEGGGGWEGGWVGDHNSSAARVVASVSTTREIRIKRTDVDMSYGRGCMVRHVDRTRMRWRDL